MLSPSIEYKEVNESIETGTFLQKFIKETLRFSAGCLNARCNGTIYFGIGDSVGGEYLHGEVVGFPIKDREVKVQCTDNLRLAIEQVFSSAVKDIASKCIFNPSFIDVNTWGAESESFYVLEVDIEPFQSICENFVFEVNLAKCNILEKLNNTKNKDLKKLKGVKDQDLLFVRKGAATITLDKGQRDVFIKLELKNYIEKRLSEEQEINRRVPESPIEEPVKKMFRLVCRGQPKLDKSTYPILVLGKPTDQQKMNTEWMENVSFVKRFPFVSAVFDFDDKGYVNGISKQFRKRDASKLISDSYFSENLGNNKNMLSQLGNDKTVWLFANGQADIDPPKQRAKDGEWERMYLGVSDAVIFFSKKTVIPELKALVLIFLFSNDFDGLIETFLEFRKRFRPDQIVIIVEERTIFYEFEKSLKLNKHELSELEECTIIGVKWKDIKDAVHQMVGFEDDSDFFIPSSTPHTFINIDERFREKLSDLSVVNSKIDEKYREKLSKLVRSNTKELSAEEKIKLKEAQEKYKRDREIEFYTGKSVSWWNFFFDKQVLERDCFKNIKSKLEKILQRPEKQQSIVLSFYLQHEPGAGGSTLGRHMLWHFHKLYTCARIHKLTEQSSLQVTLLWRAALDDSGFARPVILLLDDVPQTDIITYETFERNLKSDFKTFKENKCLKCILIQCRRLEETFGTPCVSGIKGLSEILVHQLSDRESDWMENKNDELENERSAEFKPEYLLSFMALRRGFNDIKIKSIVIRLMKDLKTNSFDFELISYVALITAKTQPNRRVPKVAIPSECIDCFYQYSTYSENALCWQRNLSRTANILIIIEDKENGAGQDCRMAHPSLADITLMYTLTKKQISLSELTMQMLTNLVQESFTHGRGDIIRIAHSMLNYRVVKVKETDINVREPKDAQENEKTSFSPLVESIIEQEKKFRNAADVLEKAFYIMEGEYEKYACTIAQTLARLYAKHEQFRNAVSWSVRSVEMASKDSKSFFLHTYGTVLKEQFLYQLKRKTTNRPKLNPDDVVPLLKLILGALEQFLSAQSYSTEYSINVLCSYKDALGTINLITSFLEKNMFSSSFDVKRYLLDDGYFGDEHEFPSDWEETFNGTLKNLRNIGNKALDVIEKHVCFYTTYQKSQNDIENHLKFHNAIQKEYDALFDKFSSMFGEESDDPPQRLKGPEMSYARDDWHRRKILMLRGNSYMNIFRLYGQFKRNIKGFSKNDTLKKFTNIIKHFSAIVDHKPSDIVVSMCTDIAIQLTNGSTGLDKKITESCRRLVHPGDPRFQQMNEYQSALDIANYFISIYMWPDRSPLENYDHTLFTESLRHLKSVDKKTKYERRNRSRDLAFYDEESGKCKPTAQFYLANENSSVSGICHKYDVFYTKDTENEEREWDSLQTKRMLRRLEGQVRTVSSSSASRQCIQLKNSIAEDQLIQINNLRGKQNELLSEEMVSFYVGFSMSGPIAFNIKSLDELDECFY